MNKLIQEEDLKQLASLAYLSTTSASITQLTHDVQAIMGFVEQLRSLDTSAVAPLCHPLDLPTHLRLDVVTEGDHTQALAAAAPAFNEQLYLVPTVINLES